MMMTKNKAQILLPKWVFMNLFDLLAFLSSPGFKDNLSIELQNSTELILFWLVKKAGEINE
jgi:hypothetical protein